MPEVRVGRGIVHQDIQLAVGLADMGKDGFDLCHLANVAGKPFGTAALCLDGIRHRLAIILLAAGHDHMGALLGQQTRDFFTDTTAGTGDQGNLARQIKQLGTHHLLSQ